MGIIKGIVTKAKTAASAVVKAVVPTKTILTPSNAAKANNAVQTVKAAVTLQGVTANTGNKAADKVLSSIASNPYVSALAVASAASPKGAVAAVKAAAPVVKSTAQSIFTAAKSSPKTAVAIGTGAVIIAKSDKLTFKDTASQAISSFDSFTTNTANFIDYPSLSTGKKIVKDDPLISGVVVGAGGLLFSRGLDVLMDLEKDIIPDKDNKNDKPAGNNIILPDNPPKTPIPDKDILPSNNLPPAVLPTGKDVPITPETQVLGKSAGKSSISRKRRAARKVPTGNQSIRLNIFNQSKHLYSYAY